MQVGDLVKHKEIPRLGIGLVMPSDPEYLGAHCMVQWTYEPDADRKNPGPTLEAKSTLEIISASR